MFKSYEIEIESTLFSSVDGIYPQRPSKSIPMARTSLYPVRHIYCKNIHIIYRIRRV